MKGKVGGFTGGKKTRAAYPTTVPAKKVRDQHSVKNAESLAGMLHGNDPFKHPSKIPDVRLRGGKK